MEPLIKKIAEEFFSPADYCDRDGYCDADEDRKFRRDLRDALLSLNQAWEERVREAAKTLKKIPTKHEGCILDEDWCYTHREIMDDGEYPNGAIAYNKALEEIIKKLL